MAALAQSPLAPSIRQPLGSLSSSRLQSLASKKNQQSSLSNRNSNKPLSRKRSHASSPDSDEENMAPVLSDSAKRTRTTGREDVSQTPRKQSPRVVWNSIGSSTPISAPVRRLPGRSPTRKAGNAFARRSAGGGAAAASYKRIDPPLRTTAQTCPAPFSLAEALRGPAIKDAHPQSWNFTIHEDTQEQEMANLMEHSTCVLDISDDEGKSQQARDARGKENIPPHDAAITPQSEAPVSRKDMMTEELRTPLGELNPKDFVPDDWDPTAGIVYDADECPKEKDAESTAEPPQPTEPTTTSTESSLLSTATVSALIQSTAPEVDQDHQQSAVNAAAIPLPADAEIEIWESGSATEEAAGEAPTESIFS